MIKLRTRQQATRTAGTSMPSWAWLLVGLTAGGMVMNQAPKLWEKHNSSPISINETHSNSSDADFPRASVSPPRSGNAEALPDAIDEPEYSFYSVLPSKEVDVTQPEFIPPPAAPRVAPLPQALAESDAQVAQRISPPTRMPVPIVPASAPTTATPIPTPVPAPVASTSPVATREVPAPAQTPQKMSVLDQALATPSKLPESNKPVVAIATPVNSAPPAAVSANNRYLLQAGAFGSSGDAEATKAKLAMMGMSARIESAERDGKMVYRVRMGPYSNPNELESAKQKLVSNGLSAIAIRAR